MKKPKTSESAGGIMTRIAIVIAVS